MYLPLRGGAPARVYPQRHAHATLGAAAHVDVRVVTRDACLQQAVIALGGADAAVEAPGGRGAAVETSGGLDATGATSGGRGGGGPPVAPPARRRRPRPAG